MKIIDMHTHIFPPEIISQRVEIAQDEPWFGELYSSPKAKMVDAEQLLASMAQAGIAHSITFGFPFVNLSLRQVCNDYVLENAAESADQLLPFVLVSPKDENLVDEMRHLAERGAQGFGELMPHGQGFGLNDPATDLLIATAQALNKPVMIHINELFGHNYAGKSGPGPKAALLLAERHPQARLVFAHWGGGLVYYETMPEVQAALQNVYYDSAALLYLYDDRAFRIGLELARERLLFGTDYPLIGQERFVQHVQRLGLDETDLNAFMCLNAARLLNIPLEEET